MRAARWVAAASAAAAVASGLVAALPSGLAEAASSPTAVVRSAGATPPSAVSTPPGPEPARVPTPDRPALSDDRLVVVTRPGGRGAATTGTALPLGLHVVERHPAVHAFTVQVAPARAAAALAALRARPDVEMAYRARLRYPLGVPPDDPRYGSQGYLVRAGFPTAWRQDRGLPSLRVAVVDSGVAVAHPDLTGKVATQHNAVTGTADVADGVGHGTAVASIAAAATDNAVGIAGAGWATRVVPVKVADAQGRLFGDQIAAGIRWAVDHGAQVVNLSLGGPTVDPLERSAVAYAVGKGVTVVAAAGNDGVTSKVYPAGFSGVVAVGATNATGARASFSQYGPWVDLAAPGTGIVAAWPGGGYRTGLAGTSFAAPLVSGAVALLRAERPDLTGAQVVSALLAHTTAVPGAPFGHGTLDVAAAFRALLPTTVPVLTSPAPGAVVHGSTTLTASTTRPYVRFVVTADGAPVVNRLVTAAAGTASLAVATYGWSSAQARAYDCWSARACNGTADSVSFTAANPAPAVTSPTDGATVDVAAHVAATVPGGGIEVLLDGVRAAFRGGTAFDAQVSTVGAAEGSHTLDVVACNVAGTDCSGPSTAVGVTVHQLRPSVSGLSHTVISPNGDGVLDSTTVSYALDVRSAVTLRLRRPDGTLVGSVPVAAGLPLAAGAHSYVWGGHVGGTVPPSGGYRLEVLTVAGGVHGLASAPVRIDVIGPRFLSVRPSVPVVYPHPDGYRDSVVLRGPVDEAVSSWSLVVVGPSGSVVRHLSGGAGTGASVAATWNGRSDTGTVVAAGTYRFRFTARDPVGNRRTSRYGTVGVSTQRLVVAYASRQRPAYPADDYSVGACSQLVRLGDWTAGLGHRSDSLCDSSPYTDGRDVAVAAYTTTLPWALRYGTVHVDVYGRAASPGSTGVLWYFDHTGTLLPGSAVGSAAGVHSGPVRSAAALLQSRVLEWAGGTLDANRYDVRYYVVRWSYYVLR